MTHGRVIFLVEERSIKTLLDLLLPRLVPGWVTDDHFRCIPFEGKSDLENNVPRKLRAWKEPGVRFVVVRDNDGADCRMLKARLAQMCKQNGRPDTLVRLVCQELESWYLGDLEAVDQAFRIHTNTATHRKKFANPDILNNAKQELRRLAPPYQQISGARALAPHIDPERNRSHSFQVFLSGVRAMHRSSAG